MPSNQYRPLTKPQYGVSSSSGSVFMRIKLQLRDPNLVAKTNRALTAISALFLGFTFLSSLITVTYQERKGSSTSACNPFIHPGFLAPLPSGLISYKTYDPSCSVKGYLSTLLSNVPSSPYHMRALPSRNPTDVQELDQKLHNKTVLLIGDSTDRSLLTHFCDLLGKRVETVNQYHPWGKSMLQVPLKHAEIPGHPGTYASKNPGDTPLGHLCYVEEYNFLLATAYHMGADISETFQGKPAWTAPTLFENRMTDLFIPFLDAMNQLRLPSLPPRPTSSPDLTILGSSFWDLARFAQEDAALMRNQVDDLSEHRLLSWRGRHIDMLSSVKKAWPSTVIGWRSMHIPTETEKTSVDWWTGGQKSTDSPDSPLFHMNRIVQLNDARRSALYPTGDDVIKGRLDRAARVGSDVVDFDWGRIMLGQDHHQIDQLHPGLNPGGSVFTDMLLHSL